MKPFPATALTLILASTTVNAVVEFSGNALLNAVNLAANQRFVVLVDDVPADSVSFSNFTSVAAGVSVSASSTYNGFTAVGTDLTGSFLTSTFASMGSVSISDQTVEFKPFAVLVYESSDTTTMAGITFRVWTDPTWIVPQVGDENGGGGLYDFGASGNFPTLSDAADYTGAVVPEPATYAALLGLGALGLTLLRRRRKA
jgi:hypothetical protein